MPASKLVHPLLFALLFPLPSRTVAAAELDPASHRRLAQALSYVNLAVDDLGWDKRPNLDDCRLSCVNDALDRPLVLAEQAARAENDFAADPAAAITAAARWLDLPAPVSNPPSPIDLKPFSGAPEAARTLLATLLAGHRAAQQHLDMAFATTDAAGRKLLRESGGRLYTDESDDDWDMTPVLTAAKKIDVASLLAAAAVLADAATTVRRQAAGLDTSGWRTQNWTLDGIRVALGGPGRDVHDATIVLDAGGDDVYGAGAVIIADLAGDDAYKGAARGLLAFALVLDLAGDDHYFGGDFSQGGAAFGASLLLDVAGDDRYEAGQCSQGSAFFGVGLLFDLAGRDAYRGTRFVQGFGGTRGMGALSDFTGNDTYYAGGKYPHAPLLPENFQSLSQGFGFGLRGADTSGGVGVLADHAGNDVYSAEIFGQGASYWYALGILADSAGHDSYNLFQYGQGAGIHLSAGVLLDRSGSDSYSCLNGVAQGCGHDWGVGLLSDLAGNDAYQGSGMSQGGANANAIGLLVDRAGNDSYSGWNVKNQGDSFFSRGTLGLGVLLDLGGQDRYTHGGRDGAVWTRGTVGVGLDCEEPAEGASSGTVPAR